MKDLSAQNRKDLHYILMAYRHCGCVRLVDVSDLGVETTDKSWVIESFRMVFNVPGWEEYAGWNGYNFQAGRVNFDAMMAAIAERFDCDPVDLLLAIEEE